MIHVATSLQVVGCSRIVHCYANEELSLADLDAEGRPHPTKTALSKLKKVHHEASATAVKQNPCMQPSESM